MEDLSYKVYITESIRLHAEHKYLNSRWVDTINKKHYDSRTGNEIAFCVIKSAGLKLDDGGEQQ